LPAPIIDPNFLACATLRQFAAVLVGKWEINAGSWIMPICGNQQKFLGVVFNDVETTYHQREY